MFKNMSTDELLLQFLHFLSVKYEQSRKITKSRIKNIVVCIIKVNLERNTKYILYIYISI